MLGEIGPAGERQEIRGWGTIGILINTRDLTPGLQETPGVMTASGVRSLRFAPSSARIYNEQSHRNGLQTLPRIASNRMLSHRSERRWSWESVRGGRE